MTAIVVAVVSYNMRAQISSEGNFYSWVDIYCVLLPHKIDLQRRLENGLFFILLAHTYFYVIAYLKFQVFEI